MESKPQPRDKTAATGTWSQLPFPSDLTTEVFVKEKLRKGLHGEKWPRKLEGQGATKEGRELQTGAQ